MKEMFLKKFLAIQEEFNSKESVKEKLNTVKKHSAHLKVVMDNDCTWCELIKPKGMGDKTYDEILREINYEGFNLPYLGHGGMISEVFALSGITAEGC